MGILWIENCVHVFKLFCGKINIPIRRSTFCDTPSLKVYSPITPLPTRPVTDKTKSSLSKISVNKFVSLYFKLGISNDKTYITYKLHTQSVKNTSSQTLVHRVSFCDQDQACHVVRRVKKCSESLVQDRKTVATTTTIRWRHTWI